MSKSALKSSNDLFLLLHQLQINIIKNTSKQTINEYKNQLADLFSSEKPIEDESNPESENLIEFLVFPILTAIKKLQPEAQSQAKEIKEWSDLNELLIQCIILVLKHVKLVSPNLFHDILNIASILLSKNRLHLQKEANKTEPSLSEEFYSECFRLVQVLFDRSSSAKVIEHFYRFKSLTLFGLLITVFLDTLSESNSLELRLEALKSLKSIIKFDKTSYANSALPKNELQDRIGSIYASFLPGISIKLVQKFLLSQNMKTLNHKLICHTLDVLAYVISHVFNDRFLDEEFLAKSFDSCLKDSNDLSKDVKSLIINRAENKEWVANSIEKLFLLIERLFDVLIANDNERVQLSLVQFCSIVGNECYVTFNKYLPKLLKILVTFAAMGENESNETSLKIDPNNLTGGDNLEKILCQTATKGLKQIENKEINNNEMNYLSPHRFSVLSTCIEEILIKLPRLMCKSSSPKVELDDKVRLSHLKTLYGYLKLIGDYDGSKQPNLKEFFHSNLQNISKLLHALVSCVSFDYKSLNNFYQIETNDNNSSSMSNYIGLKTYLDDKVVFEQLSLICGYLGRSNAARLLVDELLSSDLVYLQQKQSQNEVMFIINLILVGLGQNSHESEYRSEANSIVNLVLNTFLNEFKQSSVEKLKTVEDLIIEKESKSQLLDEYLEEDRQPVNLTSIRNRKILETCLVLESISGSSKCLTQSDYNTFLIDTLYFTLENYLNTNLLIRVVSIGCLEKLASNLGYKSIQDLLSTNYDYIMNDLILKSSKQNRTVKNSTSSKETSQEMNLTAQSSHVFVLCALLDISNSDLVPYLERLVDDYFFSIEINGANFEVLIGMCRIMIHMSKSMRNWYPIEYKYISKEDDFINIDFKQLAKDKQKADYNKSFIGNLSEIDKNLNEFRENLINLDKLEDEKEDYLEEDDKNEEESEKKVELHVKLQSKCLTICVHLISHPFKQVRLLVLDLIKELSRNLAEHTNEFLPLVHKLWAPICQRFSYDDLIVKSKIVYLLFDLSVLCGEFISSRFCKEFLPRLCSFMSEQAKISLKSSKTASDSSSTQAPGDPTYIYSHAFKLQYSILCNIDKMCILFDIKELELENVIESILVSCLDRRQPKRLQIQAASSIKNCALIDSDIVWLCLHYVLPFNQLESTNSVEYSKFVRVRFSNIQLGDEIFLDLVDFFSTL